VWVKVRGEIKVGSVCVERHMIKCRRQGVRRCCTVCENMSHACVGCVCVNLCVCVQGRLSGRSGRWGWWCQSQLMPARYSERSSVRLFRPTVCYRYVYGVCHCELFFAPSEPVKKQQCVVGKGVGRGVAGVVEVWGA